MHTRILVPLDGSAFSERALPFATALARRSGAPIELVHVHEPYLYASGAPMTDPTFDNEEKARIHKQLEGIAVRLRTETGLEIDFVCLTGAPARTLQEHISTSTADLVVMTTHGRGGVSRAWLGSVADHVVRHSRRPVLLVRTASRAPADALFRRILVPLDGFGLAETALAHAMLLATPGETELRLLSVLQPIAPLNPPLELTSGSGSAHRRPDQNEPREYLESRCAELAANGLNASADVIAHRHVARSILTYADQHDVDLIAIATHGDSGLTRLFLGSLADKVLRGAATSLLVHHPRGSADDRVADRWKMAPALARA